MICSHLTSKGTPGAMPVALHGYVQDSGNFRSDSDRSSHMPAQSRRHGTIAQVHQELLGEKPGADGLPGADRDGGCGEELVTFGPLSEAVA